MINLGVTPQHVDYNSLILSAIAYNKFSINNTKYTIHENFNTNKIAEITPLLKDDEMFGYANNAIFTYIIGSQCQIINNQIIRHDYLDNNININDMHIWVKPSLSIQEIQTKHTNILFDSKKNYDNIIAAANDPTIDVSLDIATGVIDNIFYAGEIRYSQLNNKRKIELNFLSGSFMTDIIDCAAPGAIIIASINNFFRDSSNILFSGDNDEIVIDTTCKTFITKKMDENILNNYVLSSDMKVHENGGDLPFYIMKLEGQLSIQENILEKYKNDVEVQNKIKELKNEIQTKKAELEIKENNVYEPNVFKGTYGGNLNKHNKIKKTKKTRLKKQKLKNKTKKTGLKKQRLKTKTKNKTKNKTKKVKFYPYY